MITDRPMQLYAAFQGVELTMMVGPSPVQEDCHCSMCRTKRPVGERGLVIQRMGDNSKFVWLCAACVTDIRMATG